MKLTNNHLHLREFCTTDLDSLTAYMIQPEMRSYERGFPDRESTQTFLDQIIQKAAEKPRKYYCLAIIIPPEDKAIGHVTLTSQNPDIREWEIGWAVQYADWGKGFATEAANILVEFAFDQLRAHRVVAFCHAENTASIKVMKKIRMKQEGHLRQTRWFNGSWADEYIYALVESDLRNSHRDL